MLCLLAKGSTLTLIITLAGPSGIHQSADFRLTRIQPGKQSSLQSDASPKQVTLRYGPGENAWQAVVAYIGVGAYKRIDTCSWITRWLNPSREWPTTLSFEAAIARVQSEGTNWLRGMSSSLGCPPLHTFVIGAMVAGQPQIVLISNCERARQLPLTVPSSELVVSRLRPRKPIVIISGQSAAVPRIERRILCSMLQSQREPKRIRERLAEVTRAASASPKSFGTVSPIAMTHSLLPDGSGGGEKYGDVAGDFIPNGLFNGLDTFDMLKCVTEHMGTGQHIPDDNRHG